MSNEMIMINGIPECNFISAAKSVIDHANSRKIPSLDWITIESLETLWNVIRKDNNNGVTLKEIINLNKSLITAPAAVDRLVEVREAFDTLPLDDFKTKYPDDITVGGEVRTIDDMVKGIIRSIIGSHIGSLYCNNTHVSRVAYGLLMTEAGKFVINESRDSVSIATSDVGTVTDMKSFLVSYSHVCDILLFNENFTIVDVFKHMGEKFNSMGIVSFMGLAMEYVPGFEDKISSILMD